MNLTRIGERAAISAIRLAPKQLYSSAVDWTARRTIPRPFRRPLYAAYSLVVGANLREVELPLGDYPTFGSFFGRRLRPGSREASTDLTCAAAPSDGVIGTNGKVSGGKLLQAKGRDYSLKALLASEDFAGRIGDGEQVTIYLSPADYHRVHAPVSGLLVGYTYVPGERFPVSPLFAESVEDLFANNERLVLELSTQSGPVAVVLVGALGVGNLSLAVPALESREFARQRVVRRVKLASPIPVARGQELGSFRLGSTVVLVFAEGAFSAAAITSGRRVQCGESIGRLASVRLGHDLARGAETDAGWTQ